MESKSNPESQPRVLVIEAAPDLAALMAHQLTEDGFRVEVATTGPAALDFARRVIPDLIVLDSVLTEMTGDEVLRALGRENEISGIPVLVLTERLDRGGIEGRQLDTTVYLTKPFSPRELVLRAREILRRGEGGGATQRRGILQAGPLQLDAESYRTSIDGVEIDLTPTEFRLLQALLERRGRTQSRKQLLEKAWPVESGMSSRLNTRTVDMHIRRLRAKLGDVAAWIQTVRGFGYRIKVPEGVE